MTQETNGKLTAQDERTARFLGWIPWLTFLLFSLLAPIPFFGLYLNSPTTDTAAVFLLLSIVALGAGLAVGGALAVLLLLYRKRWHERLRDRLASDGITTGEVQWFSVELTSNERETLADIQKTNPLLADAYLETLASRLTATRIITRTKREVVNVDRRLNRARYLEGADTTSLLRELNSDRAQLDKLEAETNVRLAETKARLQTIEAAASRTLGRTETDLMLRRLSAAQDHLPLSIEIERMEEEVSAVEGDQLDSPLNTEHRDSITP